MSPGHRQPGSPAAIDQRASHRAGRSDQLRHSWLAASHPRGSTEVGPDQRAIRPTGSRALLRSQCKFNRDVL